ncbi:hypothetical protein NH340_JMT03863 [Sarcoptes scabiei]|nr:hypothetical protein NH340_JMT03863 [Sarcoptes scabiei]
MLIILVQFRHSCYPHHRHYLSKRDHYGDCQFPEHWWGSWFQKGVAETIYISRNNISEKGLCRRINGEKFLIENRNDKCIRCLVITERHMNVLQYKETNYCHPIEESSFDICFDINGDAPLFSLFRVKASPIKCPFKGPFTFSYSKGILNECKDPLSTIDECTDDRHMQFKFRACADIQGSESKVEKLECIAEWREGTNRYLVGKLEHRSSSTTYEDQFRCFVIEKNNTDRVESYNVGQSGDASCEALFTPRDGSRTFKLRKASQIRPLCDFPLWLLSPIRWTTLDNRFVYDFSALNQFTVFDNNKEVLMTAKCIGSEKLMVFPSSATIKSASSKSSSSSRSSNSISRFNTSRFIIHTTVQCQNGYACMQAYQRNDRIIEIQIGKIVSDHLEACVSNNFDVRTSNYITLTTLDQETRPCELIGLYSIRTKIPYGYGYSPNRMMANHNHSRLVSFLDSRFMCQEKALKLKSNCDEPNLFQFICTTNNRVKNFYCRGGWREDQTQYILVSLKDKFNYEYCVTYNIQNNEIRLIRNSHFCYRKIDVNSNETLLSSSILFRPESNTHGSTIEYNQQQYPMPPHQTWNRHDESVSFALINEGSCQRSGSISNRINFIQECSSIAIVTIYLIFVHK